MPDFLATQLLELQQHRLAEHLDLGPDIVYPYYDGYSLVNLPASICRWLGVPEMGARALKSELVDALGGPFQHVILLVVDGIGLDLFLRITQPESSRAGGAKPVWERLLPDGLTAALTSILPSTTATALTTLWTGRSAIEHGMMGYEVWLKEYGMVANMILHSPASYQGDTGGLRRAGFEPGAFLPVPTLGPHLANHGVETQAYMPAGIARSGLSTMHLPGVTVLPYQTRSDLWISLEDRLQRRPGERTYTYVYWGDIDYLSHRHGPDDERVRVEFASFSLMLERFLARLKGQARRNTLFVLTADHGHIPTQINPAYEIRNHPELMAHLVMQPTGEGRLPYLHVRSGREDAMRAYVEETWPGQFRLFPSSQVIQSGLFGPGEVYPPVYDRMGDWTVFPQGDAYWWFANKENPLTGRHGGLSRQEMLVPFFGLVL